MVPDLNLHKFASFWRPLPITVPRTVFVEELRRNSDELDESCHSQTPYIYIYTVLKASTSTQASTQSSIYLLVHFGSCISLLHFLVYKYV